MGLLDQWNLANDANFQAKVRMAAIDNALVVVAEDRTKGFGDYYDKRARLADTVLGVSVTVVMGGVGHTGDSDGVVSRIALAVATQEGIDAPSPDADIQAAVVALWDSLAGVTDDDRPEAVTP